MAGSRNNIGNNVKAPVQQNTPQVTVSRRWLTAMLVLVTVPWLTVGAVFLWKEQRAQALTPRPVAVTAPASVGEPGPWGQLVTTPIAISPPLDYIATSMGEDPLIEWAFPLMTGDELERMLVSFGLAQEEAARLRATARDVPRLNVLIVSPDRDTVLRMSPETRARVYLALGQVRAVSNNGTLNFPQATSFRYFGTSPDDWLGTRVSPATRQLVDPLIYRHNGFMYFADLDLIRHQLDDAQEMQMLVKRLLRQSTLLVRLRVNDQASIKDIADYWGRGGRRTDLLPLLESVDHGVGDGALGMIDIVHLLPPVARENLYRYPRPTFRHLLGQPAVTNCLWTALNFFNQNPDEKDDRYLDPEFGLKQLADDYYLVYDNFQLGDVVVFTDPRGRLVHAAVYLADDLLFTKNGMTELTPWSILPLDQFKGYFAEYADTWRVTYHRRKDM